MLCCCTPYRQAGIMGGYSSTQLAENEWIVRFKGNGFTSSERSSDYCLLRCAEIAHEQGYNYFVIVESESLIRESRDYNATSRIYGNTVYTDIDGYTIAKPSDINRVILFPEKPEGFQVYETNFVIVSVRDKYNLWKN